MNTNIRTSNRQYIPEANRQRVLLSRVDKIERILVSPITINATLDAVLYELDELRKEVKNVLHTH